MPTVPISSSSQLTLRNGGLCTVPSNLSVHAAYENILSILLLISASAWASPTACDSPARNLFSSLRQIFRHVIQNLRAVVGCALRPSRRLASSLYRVTNVLAIPVGRLAKKLPVSPRAPQCCSPSRVALACHQCKASRCGRWAGSRSPVVFWVFCRSSLFAAGKLSADFEPRRFSTSSILLFHPRVRTHSRDSRQIRTTHRTNSCS